MSKLESAFFIMNEFIIEMEVGVVKARFYVIPAPGRVVLLFLELFAIEILRFVLTFTA